MFALPEKWIVSPPVQNCLTLSPYQANVIQTSILKGVMCLVRTLGTHVLLFVYIFVQFYWELSERIKIFSIIIVWKGWGGDIWIPVYLSCVSSEVNNWCPHNQTIIGDYSVALWGGCLLSFQTGLGGGTLVHFLRDCPLSASGQK